MLTLGVNITIEINVLVASSTPESTLTFVVNTLLIFTHNQDFAALQYRGAEVTMYTKTLRVVFSFNSHDVHAQLWVISSEVLNIY